MEAEQILQYTKEKALWLGSKTKEIGTKAALKISHKVSSGQLKEDIKKVGSSAKATAKNIWNFALSKVKELKKDKD